MMHFVGGVLVSTFIHDSWAFVYLWPLVIIFNASSALLEISVLIAVHVLKLVMYGGD